MITRRSKSVVERAAGLAHEAELLMYVDDGNFTLKVADGTVVAECRSSVQLSNWAFENGAKQVKFTFDLRLAVE